MNVDELLAALPDHPPRSKLEPYDQVILGLRRKRWTYQMIADYLSSQFGVAAARNTIHDFVRVRQTRSLAKPSASKGNVGKGVGAASKVPIPAGKFSFDPTKPLTLAAKESTID
jgi:hypothetical protein